MFDIHKINDTILQTIGVPVRDHNGPAHQATFLEQRG
jgi:hypothetical protein